MDAKLIETEHPRFGTVRQLAGPVTVGGPQTEYRHAPQRNEDADLLLRSLGDDDQKIIALGNSESFGESQG